ncbi:right-handed parallel beta-helix repeat-containing protein [Winogradskyella bathintestinalis]|uniref:Right-handed parallel beta-helix repeat-containing protein n=1 Tax=Winogradskyella bathintestinalis TaxID=3035208 RepID=A0ABT7ZZ37_9FLAO|nr:right-handed parallel beta-helix repeat-containing protein [Winogradskyella bathintestinalis]MDN3494269.1 right-handed parallel beta-helix repeat-containing protein [Winogradskyella bathintestinalis]
MKKILPLLLLLFSIFSYSSEINGNVFLDNTSDHSGIVIKFNPVSPSAVYIEGVSNSIGEYSITVVNGVYNISYEKDGYQTYTITNQLISTDDTLTSVTLNSNTAVNVSGNISGNWTNNNTYIVNGDITIPPSQTLNIEPGTEVRFDGYYSLIVNGTLTAVGTENNKINITSNSTNPTNNDWNQIKINSTSASSEINYCVIEYGHITDFAETGFIEINGEVTISNSTIKNSNGPAIKIALNYSGDVLIDNCEINDSNYGIYNSGIGEILITNNRIFDINTIGVYENIYDSQTTIRNNIIYNCPYTGITSHSDILIERNILFNNGHGNPYGAGVFVVDGTPIIANNTMFSNKNGVGIYDNDFYNPQPIINSNIIINNSDYGIISQGEFQPSVVAYNLFNNNTNGVGNNIPVGVGLVITTNANGTDSDAYYNIFSSAQLISINPTDSNFCELNSISDAINAGDPNIVNNYNSTVIDIGAKESSETLSINGFSNYDFIIYPNPVVNEIKIQSKNTQLFDRIVIYNIKGQIIKEYNLENSKSEYKLENLNNLKSGIHLMSIYNNFKKIHEIKLLKK